MADGLAGYALSEVLTRDGLVRRHRATTSNDLGQGREHWVTRLEVTPGAPVTHDAIAATAAVAALPAEGVVPLREVVLDADGLPVAISAPVVGTRLSERLKEAPLAPEIATRLALDLARTVAAAHAQEPPLLHGAIRPSAIVVDEKGFARLDDYALGRAMGPLAQTQREILEATAAYHSPELASGAALGPGADCFAIATVTYEAITGVSPFRGATAVETLMRLSMGKPPAADARVGPALLAALKGAWLTDPKKRSTASSLVASLEAILGPDDPRRPTAVAPRPAIPRGPESAEEPFDPLDAATLRQTELPNHVPDDLVLPGMAEPSLSPDPDRGALVAKTAVLALPAVREVVGMPDDVPTMRGESMALADILAAAARVPKVVAPPPKPREPAPALSPKPSVELEPRLIWAIVGLGALLVLLIVPLIVILATR